MKRSLDAGNIREALKFASSMTGELRTSKLSPQNYYELYMNVTDELRELESFLEDEDQREQKGDGGRSVVEMYELVQHAGNIVPRLYLLVTVGSVYIRSKKAPAKDILFDLVELCRGVQHPMRGLFLRNYLSSIAKDKLPDYGNEYEGVGGSIRDSIEFILQNFGEMNKLWVRMQHQGALKDKSRRETERRNLRQLVGINLVRLSNLNGVDLQMYKELVLPRVLEQIVNCKDVIAQEYLMDSVIQVFPDEFHLNTLELFLSTCTQLQPEVNVNNIIITLMNRLLSFAKTASGDVLPKEIDMFAIFLKYSSKVIEANPKLQLTDLLALQVALVNFTTNVYPDNLANVDHVLGFSESLLKKVGPGKLDGKTVKQVEKLLASPLEPLSLRILELQHYGPLLDFLNWSQRKAVAVHIVQAILRSRAALDSLEKADTFFKYIAPLIKDEAEPKQISEDERFEFDQDQLLVARLFHLVGNEDSDIHYKLYQLARKYFGQGGTQRIEHTLPPLVFGSLELAKRVFAREEKSADAVAVSTRKVFQFVHETISVLTSHFPELAFRLFLQAAQVADKTKFEAIAYEFVAQAFIAYEDEISDSRAQFNAITYMVATLQNMSVFGQENYETLVSKATQHCAKLLKKTDQCRAIYNAAHLFWPGDDAAPGHRDDKRVLACLQRALKIANGCMGQQVHLFVEILNKFLYFYDRNCPAVTVKYVKGLIALINEHLPSLDNSEASQAAKQHFQNTLLHIKAKQTIDGEVGVRYTAIEQAEEEAMAT